MTLSEKVGRQVAAVGGVKRASEVFKVPMTTLSHLLHNPNHDARMSTLRKLAKADDKPTWLYLKEIEEEAESVSA